MNADSNTFTDEDEPALKVLDPGTVVAERYRIIEPIGQGGMGIVYKAEQIHMDRLVALKMMIQETTAMSADYRRFQREAQAASLLDHPNIVAIHDFGFADGQAYLCMDYLEGQSLEELIENKPLSLDQFRHIFKQACDALQHAHEKGIVHRDLKPSNMMISKRRQDPYHLVILDFGLVKLMDNGGNHKLTATNMVVGSPFYMSPEQCRGTNLDQRSDIYTLGCVMYESLARVPPFVADSIFDLMNSHISKEPLEIREMAPGVYVPPALERSILKALAKTPEQRQQSMKELSQEIESSFSGAPDMVHISRSLLKGVEGGKSQEMAAKKRKKKAQNLLLLNLGIWIGLACLIATAVMVGSFLKTENSKIKVAKANDSESDQKKDDLKDERVSADKSVPEDPASTAARNADQAGKSRELPPNKAAQSGLISIAPLSSNLNSPLKTAPSGQTQPRASSVNSASEPKENLPPQDEANQGELAFKEAETFFKKNNWSKAKAAYLRALQYNLSERKATEAYGKLAVSSYYLDDKFAAREYEARYNQMRALNPADSKLINMLATTKRLLDNSGPDLFSRGPLRTAAEGVIQTGTGIAGAASDASAKAAIHQRIIESKSYADQGDASRALEIMQEVLVDAKQNAPELVSRILSDIVMLKSAVAGQRNFPPAAGFNGAESGGFNGPGQGPGGQFGPPGGRMEQFGGPPPMPGQFGQQGNPNGRNF